MRTFVLLWLVVFAVGASAATDTVMLDAAQAQRLRTLAGDAELVLGGFPDGYGHVADLTFKRMDLLAPGAKIIEVGADGEHELPRSHRAHLIGRDAAGSVRTSLDVDPITNTVGGNGQSANGPFTLVGALAGDRLRIRVVPSASMLPAGIVPRVESGDDGLPSGRASLDAPALSIGGATPAGGALRRAIVAVDTDTEFMSARFGNNTSAAADWIGDLFAAMNVMYERDLDVELQQGTTYLRTSTDPYTVTTTPAASANLEEFGNIWQASYGSVARSFAILLSGKSSSGNSASGIAWINAYCRTASQGGSYSVNQIFTNSAIGVGYSALIVGHELGHNFGAYHTHCTDASTGTAPTGSNTIDRCYSGEASCYSGTTSCPTSGPGAPAGTVMSYCANIGCGPDHSNVLQFHPTEITVLNARIAQNTPSCLAVSVDTIFANGFE